LSTPYENAGGRKDSTRWEVVNSKTKRERLVPGREVEMVEEEAAERDAEHARHEEEEEHVEAAEVRAREGAVPPEGDEVGEDGEEAEHAQVEAVAEEQHEELVVAVVDARVHPRAVMVELAEEEG
jgi:hypothetical protein